VSVVAAVEQLSPGTIVRNAAIRRWADADADDLARRAGVSWSTGEDELGPARYAILRRRAEDAAPMVFVAYENSPGIDVLAADETPDVEIDALLNELGLASSRTSSGTPGPSQEEATRALAKRVERLEQKTRRRRVRRNSVPVTEAAALRAVKRSPGRTSAELAAELRVDWIKLEMRLDMLRASGQLSSVSDRWYLPGTAQSQPKVSRGAPGA
jgi:hypothetical protein